MDDSVNATRRAIRAEERVRSNGNSHRVLHEAEAPKPEILTHWQRLLRLLPAKALPSNWERVIVNNSVDSVTMPKWVASAILIAILAFGAQSWWARSVDHDTMVRIETELRDAKEAEKEAKDEQRRLNGDMQAWREIMNGNQKQIIGMLSQAQTDSLDKQKKSNQ